MHDDSRGDDALLAGIIVLGVIGGVILGFSLIYSVFALITEGVLLPPLVALILLTVTVGPTFLVIRFIRHRPTTRKTPP